jgi:hypothetical protein
LATDLRKKVVLVNLVIIIRRDLLIYIIVIVALVHLRHV